MEEESKEEIILYGSYFLCPSCIGKNIYFPVKDDSFVKI